MNEEGHPRVGQKMVGFPRGRVGGHDDCWMRVEGSGREIGIRHERNMGGEIVTCCQMKLFGQKHRHVRLLSPFLLLLLSLYPGADSQIANFSDTKPPPTEV